MRKTAKDKNGEEYDVGVIVCLARYQLGPEVAAARGRLKARGFLEPHQEDETWAKTLSLAKAVLDEHDKDYDNLGNYIGVEL